MCDLLLTAVELPSLTTSCIKPPPPTGDHLLETLFKVKLLQLEPLINHHLLQATARIMALKFSIVLTHF